MKYGSVTLGQVEAVINKLGGEEVLRRILSGEVTVSIVETVKKATNKLLELVGVVTVSVSEKFVVRDHFVVNTSDDAPVRIGWVSDYFQSKFLGKVEEPTGEVELKPQRLRKYSVDGPIIEELGNFAETIMAELWALLKLQPKGESGMLLTNGYWNVFYVRDVEGVLRAVNVSWNADDGNWDVIANSVEDLYGWRADSRIFSRNSQSA